MLVLATDLDGTFLEGTFRQRNHLYQFINNFRKEIILVFVTGRALDNVIPLLEDAFIPKPNYIIADIGATIVCGETLVPIEPMSSEFAQRWVGEEDVLLALPKYLEIERQQQAQQRRCSFYTTNQDHVAIIKEAVSKLDCDVLYSANRYLDVLPRGISKGYTLQRLIRSLDIADANVLVAGDTMNDTSMFLDTPFKGVVVSNGELGLINLTAGRSDTLHATQEGAAGIMEALTVFGFTSRFSSTQTEVGDASLVIVYHRQPFDETLDNGKVSRALAQSPNGILPTLLGLFSGGRKGAWVAWSTLHNDVDGALPERLTLSEISSSLTISRVMLTKQDVELFYQKFSKEALWPIIHNFVERSEFDHSQWQHFCIINRRFAEQAAREVCHGGTVWVHDYNLWMVPKYIKEIRPDAKVAFFHHTPFPCADIFNIIPWSDEIMESLLHCDYIGFHIPRYAENFVDCVRSFHQLVNCHYRATSTRFFTRGTALSVDRAACQVEVEGNTVAIGVHPVGLDLKRIEVALSTSQSRDFRVNLRKQFVGKKLVVCAERLDYMKGPLQRIQAFERFLSLYPVWREKISFVYICTPPTDGMKVYDDLRYQVEHAAGRLNSRFASAGWTPLTLMFKYADFDELSAYLATADVAWITPLRDGLNLVAKEFVAIKSSLKLNGSLIISEFAGVSVEMNGALLTNPFDTSEMAATLEKALSLSAEEQEARLKCMSSTVENYDVHQWVDAFMKDANIQEDVEVLDMSV